MDNGSETSTLVPTEKMPIRVPAKNLSKKRMAVHSKAKVRITGELYLILIIVVLVK